MERQNKEKHAINYSIPSQFSTIAKNLGIGFFAAIVTGVISGLLLRLIMKIIAMAFPHMARGFTLEGTVALIMVGIGFSLANSMIYMYIFRNSTKRWFGKGIIYGCINLVVYGIPFFLSNPDNDLFGPQAPLGIILFSILFLVGGLILALLVSLIQNWVHQAKGREKYAYFCFACFIVPATVMSFGIIFEIFTELIPAIKVNF